MNDDVREVREITRRLFNDTYGSRSLDRVEELRNGQIVVELTDPTNSGNAAWQGFRLVPYIEAGYIPTSTSTNMAWFTPANVGITLPVRNKLD